MWPAYLKGIAEHFPRASVTFDKFHVMKILNHSVDQVRRAEQRVRPELRDSRYVWTKNPENLSPARLPCGAGWTSQRSSG